MCWAIIKGEFSPKFLDDGEPWIDYFGVDEMFIMCVALVNSNFICSPFFVWLGLGVAFKVIGKYGVDILFARL